nr:recombinase RecT [Clostridium sp. AF15-41]
MNELAVFINLCRFNGLNPWLKEAYCIKYGNEPATMVVGKEALISLRGLSTGTAIRVMWYMIRSAVL